MVGKIQIFPTRQLTVRQLELSKRICLNCSAIIVDLASQKVNSITAPLHSHFTLPPGARLLAAAAAKARTRTIAAQSELSKPPEVRTSHTEQSIDNYIAG